MKGSRFDYKLVRQYLLGQLNDREDLENEISESILVNEDAAAIVETVEDAIMDDYLDGALDPAERSAVDNYFLRPAERRDRLHFVRLMRDHFDKRQESSSDSPANASSVTKPDIRPNSVRSIPGWRALRASYLAIAALLIIVLSGMAYVSDLRRKQTALEHALAQERTHAVSLAQEAPLLQASMIALTLVSERSRDVGLRIPNLEIKPTTRRIIVEIALPSAAVKSYEIELESKGSTPIWKARLMPIVSASGDARLVFDVPAKLVESGRYSFLVTSESSSKGSQSYYDFDVRSRP
jgi:anti-sigma factor RsiW